MRIFFVGLPKVPYANRACDIRLKSFAELFASCGSSVYILNRYSAIQPAKDTKEGHYTIVELIKKRKTKKLTAVLFLLSIIKEFFFLVSARIADNQRTVLHVYSGHYADMLFYWIISRICGYKIVYQYVEFRSVIKTSNLYHKVNGLLVDRYGPTLWDGMIPISNFLKEQAIIHNKKLKYIQIPPICDFSSFDSIECVKEAKILYCGSADYSEVIKLLVDAYRKSSISNVYKLELIIAGKQQKVDYLKEYAKEAIVMSNLSYTELIQEYKSATILMIPLRNNIKDISRFPNKICEYAASQGTILTTRFGEPAFFFKDKVSAVISDDYSIDSLASSLDWIYKHPEETAEIANKGYEIGKMKFNITCYQEKMNAFLSAL